MLTQNLRDATYPLAIFTVFVLGIEVIIGLVLGLSDGLSELHKTVLVGFVCGFPVVTLIMLWSRMKAAPLSARDEDRSWQPGEDSATGQPAE